MMPPRSFNAPHARHARHVTRRSPRESHMIPYDPTTPREPHANPSGTDARARARCPSMHGSPYPLCRVYPLPSPLSRLSISPHVARLVDGASLVLRPRPSIPSVAPQREIAISVDAGDLLRSGGAVGPRHPRHSGYSPTHQSWTITARCCCVRRAPRTDARSHARAWREF